MQFIKNVCPFLNKSGWRFRRFRIAPFTDRRLLVTAVFLIAAVVTGGLLRRHLASVRQLSRHQETMMPATAADAMVPVRGLSHKRKGFDDAIAELGTAAVQNHRLAAYYDRVIKRTEGQSADAEPLTSIKASVASANPEPLGRALVPSASRAAGGDSEAKAPAEAGGQVNGAHAGADSSPALTAEALKTPAAGSERALAAARASQSSDLGKTRVDGSVGQASNSPRGSASLVAGDVKFDLNPAIDHWVNYYTETRVGRSTMQQGLDRSAQYLDASRADFRELGLPEDLVWVAQVESVWKQGAYSRVAAGGIWQFMPRTAADYGLSVAGAEDERFDPAKETRAAATYLHDLYTLFGNWELALAAYNCGEPRLMDAIVREGQPDFWELYDQQLLPKETRNYVPKILAAIKVASDPGAFGFTVGPLPGPEPNTPPPAPN